VLALCLAQAAHAVGDGSPYSLFGIGEITYAPGNQSTARGYTGIGLALENSINGIAPASWARINRTRIEAGLLYQGFKTSDSRGSLLMARSDFNGALLALPVDSSRGIVFVGGVTPYSRVNYNFFQEGSSTGVDHTINYVGKGGLAKAQGGLSYALGQDLAVGASVNYVFGSLEHQRIFLSSAGGTTNGTWVDKTSARGLFGTFGLRYSGFGKILEGLDGLSMGLVVDSRATLKGEQQTTYSYQSIGEGDTSQTSYPRLAIPVAYGIGLAVRTGQRYILAADYYAQPWSTADFFGTNPEDLRNSYRLGIGGERMGNSDPSARWLDRVAYRLGLRYDATYYRINGEPINEWGITGGLGIPLGGESFLNLAVEYGGRGTTDKNLVKEQILKISASLSISELWFVRYEEE